MTFDGDGFNPLGPALPFVRAAAELGGRADAAGDPDGASRLCACAARLARAVRGLPEVADFRLAQALEEAEGSPEPAAALQRAFDSLLPDEDADPPPDDPLKAAQHFIELAISVGAPAYNLGDRQGCYDVYSCTARMLLTTRVGTDDAQARLRQALEEAAALTDPNKQAWAMRHGFDAVLAMGEEGGPALAPVEVQQLLAMAVRIGAPAFNLGDARGCYEVYACTARLLLGSPAPEDVRGRLRAALEEASVVPDVARQAWILRGAFDAILGAEPDEDGEEEDEG